MKAKGPGAHDGHMTIALKFPTDIRVARHLWTTAIARSRPDGEEGGRIGNGNALWEKNQSSEIVT